MSRKFLAPVVAAFVGGFVCTATPATASTSAHGVPGTNDLFAVACLSGSTCLAVGDNSNSEGVVVPATNGIPASPQQVPGTELQGVACPSATTCFAVGAGPSNEGALVPITNGVAGSAQAVSGTLVLDAVACSSATTCLAVGDSSSSAVALPIINGVPGSPQPLPIGDLYFGVACSSATTCVVVSDLGGNAHPQGVGAVVPVINGIPGAAHIMPGTDGFTLAGVACPSATTCQAVGFDYASKGSNPILKGVVVPIINGTPGTAQVINRNTLFGVACSSATTCLAVGANTSTGVMVPITHGLAGSPAVIPGTELLQGAACSSTTCLAVGENSSEGVVATLAMHSPPVYVALGDSYSSGEGNPPYLVGTNHHSDECHRSPLAYPFQAANDLGFYQGSFSFHACSGAVIQDFYRYNASNHERPQLYWLTRSSTVKLVSLTIGGNNIDFPWVMATCVFDPNCRLVWQHTVNHDIAHMSNASPHNPVSLAQLFKHIRQDAPQATILVVGYPRLFPEHPPSSCYTGLFGFYFVRPQMDWINSEGKKMDQALARAAHQAGVKYVNAYDAFQGHELCTRYPYLNRFILHGYVGSFHPNIAGHRALARLVESAY